MTFGVKRMDMIQPGAMAVGGMAPDAFGMADPLGMMPVEPDPFAAAMGDPLVMMELIRLITEEANRKNGPTYPRWYKPSQYQKPKLSEYTAKARSDRNLYSRYIEQVANERLALNLKTVGQFPDAEEESEMQFQDPSMVHDYTLGVNLVAGCDVNYDARTHRAGDAEIVEKKELFAHAFREKWKRRNTAVYGTDLSYDEARFAMGTGRLVARLSLDFDAESDEVPIKADLLDPCTVFPTFDDHGIASVTRVYYQTVAQVATTFDNEKVDIRKKLLAGATKNESGVERNREADDQVEVIEYWDRRWYAVSVEGHEAVNAEHKFGFVPFVYIVSPLGDAGQQSASALSSSVRSSIQTAQDDIASKGRSHIWAIWKAHEQREAILGRMFTELKKTGNPPRTVEQDPSIYGDAPALGDAEGGVYMMRAGLEREVGGPQKPGFSLIGPVMGAANEAQSRGMLPASSYGLTQNANESGTAIEGLNESGRDKITPWLTMMQRWDAECAEMSLRMVRDWGHLLGSDGSRGTFEIELFQKGSDTVFTITPDEIRQVGTKIRSKRTSLRLSNLGALGNALSSWKANGWLLDEDALEMRGVEDPVAYLRRVQIQEMKKDPEYMKVKIIQMMEQEGDYAGAEMYRRMLQNQMRQPAPPPPGGMPPGGMPPGAPGGPGTMGGSPPGSGAGPQMAQPIQGAMGMPSRMAGPPPDLSGIG